MSAYGRSKVKRRPLPGNGVTPDMIIGPPGAAVVPVPGRARHGPREIGTPSRANSMPPESIAPDSAPFSTPPAPQFQTPPNNYNDRMSQYDEPQAYDDGQFSQPDFLPQLPPSNRQRGHHSRQPSSQATPPAHHHRAQSHAGLHHSHSAPIVPTAEPDMPIHPGYGLHTDAPEPLPDLEYQHQQLRQRRNDVRPGWENPYDDPMTAGRQPYVEDEDPGPPPPPMHSHSAPVVPHFSPSGSPATSRYGGTPPSMRQQYVNNASPLQSIERGYGTPPRQTPERGHAARGRSVDDYTPSPPATRGYDNTPPSLVPGTTPSPVARSPAARTLPHRHSVADPYYSTPPRPHPLSQEVPRARSPLPPTEYGGSQYGQPAEYRNRDAIPLIKPRAISPQPSHASTERARPKSSYNLQHPIRAFESSDQNPLSSNRPLPNRSTPTRKSVSPHPSPPNSAPPAAGGIPFGPDSFDIHNPSAGSRAAPLSAHTNSPNAPYHIRPDQNGTPTRDEQRGPIVGWDGREIDPSDHLPVDSWAPEPKKKTPTKEYGLGRDRDFGPRTQGATGSPASGQRLSKDTVVNFRMKSHANSQPSTPPSAQQAPEPTSSRSRLTKNLRSSPSRSPMAELSLREHANYNPVPDPYAQQEYSRGFHDGSPGMGRYDQNQQYGYPAPPPKLPLDYGRPGSGYGGGGGGFGEDALSREIAQIDLGAPTGSTRRMGAMQQQRQELPSGWGGVRNQRDRGAYY